LGDVLLCVVTSLLHRNGKNAYSWIIPPIFV
jgi:hypothetical protein